MFNTCLGEVVVQTQSCCKAARVCHVVGLLGAVVEKVGDEGEFGGAQVGGLGVALDGGGGGGDSEGNKAHGCFDKLTFSLKQGG